MSNEEPLEAPPPAAWVPVYITSKRMHAAKVLEAVDRHPLVYLTSRWPVVRDISREQNRPVHHWFNDNVDDIIRSRNVVCYAEPTDLLSGSLVELGVAWAHGKTITLVGQNDAYKEWSAGPRIRRVPRLDDALKEIEDTLRRSHDPDGRVLRAIDGARSAILKHVDAVLDPHARPRG